MIRARSLSALLAFIVVFVALAAPAVAKPPDGSSPIPACAYGGYRAYSDSSGKPLTSTRQCTKYVQRGGVLVPRFGLGVTFTEPSDGQYYVNVTGFGLKPGAILYVASNISNRIDVNMVGSGGNIEFTGGFYSCGTFAWLEYSTIDKDGYPIATRVATPC